MKTGYLVAGTIVTIAGISSATWFLSPEARDAVRHRLTDEISTFCGPTEPSDEVLRRSALEILANAGLNLQCGDEGAPAAFVQECRSKIAALQPWVSSVDDSRTRGMFQGWLDYDTQRIDERYGKDGLAKASAPPSKDVSERETKREIEALIPCLPHPDAQKL